MFRFIFLAFCWLLHTCPYATLAQTATATERVRNADIKNITLRLRFDWAQKQAVGAATITLAPLQAADNIRLDAGMLAIHNVALSDQTALAFRYDGGDQDGGLEISLNRRYSAGEDLTITIEYHTQWVNATDPNNLGGSNGKGIRFFEPTATDPRKRRQIWSAGEPEANRYWFPGYDGPGDLRTTEFIATVDKGLTAISNGTLVGSRTNADGTRTFHWKADVPYANVMTGFVVGEYVDVPQKSGATPIHNFGYLDETDAVAASVVQLPDMMRFYAEITGTPYPFDNYSQVFVQELPWGLGGNTLSVQSENMVDDARTHAEYFYLWDQLEAEALAQQWFGNYLTCRDWRHIWLSKAFSRYFAGMYMEHKAGREEYLLYHHPYDHNTMYLGDWYSGVRHPIVVEDAEKARGFATDNYPYFHGASVLHLLRQHLGEKNWQKAIRLYVRDNARGLVTTDDFRRAVETASGENMGWFFDQWIYKMGHPVFEIAQRYDAAQQQLILTARQTQQPDTVGNYPQVAFFQGKVSIEIDDRIEQVWLEPKAENIIVLKAQQAPKLVHFDYESAWIKEIRFEKTLEALLYQCHNDQDVLGKRWAMNELVSMAKNEKTPAEDLAKIYAALRQTIGGSAYWRLRYMAIVQLQNLLAPAGATQPATLDAATTTLLLHVVKNEKAWLRAAAISFLGLTQDARYAEVYRQALHDECDRVINAAATALGRSKSPDAFEALVALADKPSWKNQSLISALNGLKVLGDPRGYAMAYQALADLNSPHWTLGTPVWDYRLAAAETIAALGKSDEAYPLLLAGFQKAVSDHDLHGIFYNALLIATLADAQGQEVFDQLKTTYKDDTNALNAVEQYETQWKDAIRQR